MHRSREHGLSLTSDGFTFDPEEREEILRRLVKYSPNPSEQTAFSIAFLFALDAREIEKNRLWRHVYLGRYMRMPPSEIENLPISLLNKYVATLSEFIKKEAGPTKMAETDYV